MAHSALIIDDGNSERSSRGKNKFADLEGRAVYCVLE